MPTSYRSVLAAFVFTMLVAAVGMGARTFSAQAAKNQAPFTIWVLASEARFVFPLPVRQDWEWYRATTGDRSREYRFSAELQNGDERYELGFFLFKYPGARPARGDIEALLRAGQRSVAAIVGDRASVLSDAPVHFMVAPTRLMVVVDDPKTLQLLFSARPSHATFNIDIPGQKTTMREATVAYEQP